MAGRKRSASAAHSGRTEKGHTRDVKVDRIGRVTIYRRGSSYSLYYRENGRSERRKIDGNLAVARATAARVQTALSEQRESPLGFRRTAPRAMVAEFLEYIATVKKLAWRTQERYRAALARFLDFSVAADIVSVDAVLERTVEDFVRWLRGQTRARNGSPNGRKSSYKVGGIRFILSTCRTAFHWALRRRMLPPTTENPFSRFPIDGLRDPDEEDQGERVFSPSQEQAFFAACSEWSRGLFLTLATYGLRAGELAHLLIDDVDMEAGALLIRSKPELFWRVKTARRRVLPLTDEMRELFQSRIGCRKAGFVFLDRPFATGEKSPVRAFDNAVAFHRHLERLVTDSRSARPEATDAALRREVFRFSRSMGQITVKNLRLEFCRLTKSIGCPEFTRVHDLRHLFSSRAQELGMNPILVQEILGHTSLSMTRRYTHLGLDAKRQAIDQLKRFPAVDNAGSTGAGDGA